MTIAPQIPATVRDRQAWLLLKELDARGENLTQWEIDFVEQLTRDLLAGVRPAEGRLRKLDEIRDDRLP
jgi:hypothetical protein